MGPTPPQFFSPATEAAIGEAVVVVEVVESPLELVLKVGAAPCDTATETVTHSLGTDRHARIKTMSQSRIQ